MNANELAYELQDLYKNYCHANAIKEAATMLIQLQAENESLKKKITSLEFLARREK